MRSSDRRLVSVVTSTRSPFPAAARISPMRFSTWPFVGRRLISGSSSPVGRISCSATTAERSSSNGPGVAEAKTVWPVICSNSAKLCGRLSSAEGRRKPKSTSTCLRARSPLYMPPICGTVAWLSSMKSRKSFGKKSIRQNGRSPALPARQVPRVVLDAAAEAHLLQHLQVVVGPHPDALRLEVPAVLLKPGDALLQLGLDAG